MLGLFHFRQVHDIPLSKRDNRGLCASGAFKSPWGRQSINTKRASPTQSFFAKRIFRLFSFNTTGII